MYGSRVVLAMEEADRVRTSVVRPFYACLGYKFVVIGSNNFNTAC
jgi:hypothetical protein